MPSTIHIGSVFPVIELAPRIRIDASEPGLPLYDVATPDIVPLSTWSIERTSILAISLLLITETEPVMRGRRTS